MANYIDLTVCVPINQIICTSLTLMKLTEEEGDSQSLKF